jgi:hypothetical protein
MARLSTRVLEVFLLALIFAVSATISSIACSVTSRSIISATNQDCGSATFRPPAAVLSPPCVRPASVGSYGETYSLHDLGARSTADIQQLSMPIKSLSEASAPETWFINNTRLPH